MKKSTNRGYKITPPFEPVRRRLRPMDWERQEGPMQANDAAVLAKFVFLVFGLGLMGMMAQAALIGG